ncbi:MAG: hypothetical protein JWQ42_1707 [Edaphobacter sp.]|nr:hypothetical protein [Edaphobacter sp.]
MHADTVATLPSNHDNTNMKSGLQVPYPDVAHSTVANLPPDPDNLNDLRAQQADDTLVSFARQRGEDDDINLETLSDLLRRMGHWCDRNGFQLADAVRMAATSYSAETEGRGRQFEHVG